MHVLYTHKDGDPDACVAPALVRIFVPGYQDAEVRFTGIDAKIPYREGDFILDINHPKGIKGDRGEGGQVHSATRWVAENLLSEEDFKLVASIVAYVDADDTTGSPLHGIRISADLPEDASERDQKRCNTNARRRIADTGLKFAIRGWKARFKDRPDCDYQVFLRVEDWVLAAIAAKRQEHVDRDLLERVEWFGEKDCRVAFIPERHPGTSNYLMARQGARFIISYDETILQAFRNKHESRVGLNDEEILDLIRACGEDIEQNGGEWFVHSAGFLLSFGSRKKESLPKKRSVVDPRELARLIAHKLKAAATAAG